MGLFGAPPRVGFFFFFLIAVFLSWSLQQSKYRFCSPPVWLAAVELPHAISHTTPMALMYYTTVLCVSV